MAENRETTTDNVPKKPSLISRAGWWMSARRGYIAAFFGGMGLGIGGTVLVQKYRSSSSEEGIEEDMTVMEEPSESLLH
jgi:hypothetical protein